MPSYLTPRLGIEQSEAFAEAAHFGGDDAVLLTLAFYHPLIVDPDTGAQVAVYVVNDFQDLTATIEAGAPLDAGQPVTFRAVPMEITLPAEGEEHRLGEVRIAISNVTMMIAPFLEAATQSPYPVEMIARVYLASDTSAPHELPPLRVTLRGATATPTVVTAMAGYGDIANRRFPAVEYRRAEFPNLAP